MPEPGSVLFSRLLQGAGIPHGFFTRQQGVTPRHLDRMAAWRSDPKIKKSNRTAVEEVLTFLAANTLALPKQVHGTRTWIAPARTAPPLIRGPEADAAISRSTETAVGIITADCVPILMASRDGSMVAAVHGGWRGLFDRIVEVVLQEIRRQAGLFPRDVIGVIGPSIGSCCYEVREDLAQKFQKRFPGYGQIVRQEESKVYLSLQEVARQQMMDAGMDETAVEEMGHCTGCGTDRFFSYRKEKGTNFRQISAIAPKTE